MLSIKSKHEKRTTDSDQSPNDMLSSRTNVESGLQTLIADMADK